MKAVYICFVFLCSFASLLNYSRAVVWFKENFDDDDWEKRWSYTSLTEYKGKPFGKFQQTAGKVTADPSDKGLRTMNDESYYAISTKIPRFSNRNRTLVIQLTVKHETKNKSVDDRLCAAVLIKLLPSTTNQQRFNGDSKFLIKYGPDFCGAGGKVHAELFYKGKYYEHKGQQRIIDFNDPFIYNPFPYCPQDGFTHLYTMAIFPNNTYQKLIDGTVEESGTLEGAWDFLPPARIKLPGERPPPEEWDEREVIADPSDVKPADWDQSEYIPDPYAHQPEEWNEADDGPWEHPIIRNPNYKGDWSPTRFIRNPNFKGQWRPDTIDNPDYLPDPDLYLFKDIAYVAMDSWQQNSGTIMDNILLTDDLEYALNVGLPIQQRAFELEERVYNDDCDRRQKIVLADLARRQEEVKAFKRRMKKMEL